MKAPMFSFVIPVYNTEKYLTRCLDGIRAQTDGDYEAIVVDDGSSGGCADIVARYGERFRCIRHERNRSVFQARLTGAMAAQGRYILQQDPDDGVNPGLLAALRKRLQSDPGLGVVVCGCEQVFLDRVAPDRRNGRPERISCAELLERVIDGKVSWAVCGKAVRADLYQSVLRDLQVPEDFYLNNTDDLAQLLPILLVGQRAAFIEYVGYRYYINGDSMTHAIFTPERIRRCADGSVASSEMVAAFARRLGRSDELVTRILEMRHWTQEWLLDEIRDLSDQLWNRCVGELCASYGVLSVMGCACRMGRLKEFMLRFVPERSLFPRRKAGPVHTIGIVCCRTNKGGAEHATYIWARQRVAEGRAIVWFCDDRFAEDVRSHFSSDGVDWPVVSLDVGDISARMEALKSGIERFGVDAVLLPDHWTDRIFVDLAVAKSAGCLTFVAEHSAFHFPLETSQFDIASERHHFYRVADVVTVLSPENVAWWKASGLSDNVVYMPNYLTFEPKAVAETNVRNPATCEILCAGRICESKGSHLALEAIYLARAKYGVSDVCLTYIGRFGSPAFEQRMRSLVRKFGLDSVVRFEGLVDDVKPYFQRARLFVMASRIEGAPMVLMEAKSHALPSVIFELPYVDGTGPGSGVLSVPYGDVDALAREIAHVATDGELWNRLSGEALRSLEPYCASRLDARWQGIFTSLSDGSPLDVGSAEVPPDRLLPLTFGALGQSLVPMSEWQLEASRAQTDLTRIRSSRIYGVARWFLRKIHDHL